jgi:hypothetical protein
MFLDDVLDRDRRLYLQSFRMRILREQGLSVAFNALIGDVRHSKGHLGRSSSASSNGIDLGDFVRWGSAALGLIPAEDESRCHWSATLISMRRRLAPRDEREC